MEEVIPTSCGSLDELLNGGLAGGSIVLVYGEAESGKTTLAMQCAVNGARMDLKTIYVDCDDAFFPRRLIQIAGDEFGVLASSVILLKPEDFEQQSIVMDRLGEYVNKKVGLIVVDTITGLYRQKLSGNLNETFALNRELNRQMACLAQISKTQKVASLVISQVRSAIGEEHEPMQPVATRVLKFWADTIINLKLTAKTNIVKAEVTTETEVRGRKPKLLFLKKENKGLRDFRKGTFNLEA